MPMEKILVFTLVLIFTLAMTPNAFSDPILYDQKLIVKKYVANLCCVVTTMTFVGDDILIVQKK